MSSLTIESSRFGRVQIDPSAVIEFPEGLIGLDGSRYALIAKDPEAAFMWLQSLEDPGLALPVTNPHRFFAEFAVEVVDEDAERLGLDASSAMDVYVTVRAAPALEDFTANLKAPILVRDGRAWQVINQAPGCELRVPLVPQGEADGAPASDAA
ncbi:MAG TPA: flagellar assembly protein FliW [Solirubrobacteraceae bacterium]|nr:flagellar assembly protein FliW [Solirubrobacteraceae bacterium]